MRSTLLLVALLVSTSAQGQGTSATNNAAAVAHKELTLRSKSDIRGFFTGMPLSAFQEKLRSLEVSRCKPSGGRTFPCLDQDPTNLDFTPIGPTTTLWFARDEPLVFWFTSNLPENKIWKLRFQFGSQKPYREILKSISDQFGLSIEPDQSGRSSGSSWKAWNLDGGNNLAFDGAPGGYDIIIQDRNLPVQDQNAKADAVRKLPNPKF